MTPEQFNAYLVSGGLVLGALYSAIRAYEAWPKVWKVVALALTAVALAASAYYYSVSVRSPPKRAFEPPPIPISVVDVEARSAAAKVRAFVGFADSKASTVVPQSGPSPLIWVSFGFGLPFRVSTSDFKLIR